MLIYNIMPLPFYSRVASGFFVQQFKKIVMLVSALVPVVWCAEITFRATTIVASIAQK